MAAHHRRVRSSRTADSHVSGMRSRNVDPGNVDSSSGDPSDGAAREGYPKTLRLRARAEYRRAQNQGQRVHTRHFLLILSPRRGDALEDASTRLGITVTKKVGSAVARNRIKRLVREVFRRNRLLFPGRCDVVVIAKKGATELRYDELLDELRRARRAMHRACPIERGSGAR